MTKLELMIGKKRKKERKKSIAFKPLLAMSHTHVARVSVD